METYRTHRVGEFYDWTKNGHIDTSAAGVHTETICRDQLDQILDAHHHHPDNPLFIFLVLQTPHCPLGEVPRRFFQMYKDRFQDHPTEAVPGRGGPLNIALTEARERTRVTPTPTLNLARN